MENPDRIDVPSNVFSVIEKHSREIDIKDLLDLIRIFNTAINDRGGSWQPTLPLEMAFLEALEAIGNTASSPAQKSTAEKPKQEKPVKQVKEKTPKKPTTQPTDTEEKLSDPGQKPLTVLQQWNDILDHVRDVSPATQGILNSCKPLGIKDNKLVLSFRSDAIKGKMENGDHPQICQDAIEKVIGVKIPILCIVGGKVCIVGGKDQSDLPDGVDPDGLVAAVVRDLGGTYVSDQDEE